MFANPDLNHVSTQSLTSVQIQPNIAPKLHVTSVRLSNFKFLLNSIFLLRSDTLEKGLGQPSHSWHFCYFESASPLLWRLTCALEGVQQHPWPLSTRCRQHPPPLVISKNVSRHCRMFLGGGGQNSPSPLELLVSVTIQKEV